MSMFSKIRFPLCDDLEPTYTCSNPHKITKPVIMRYTDAKGQEFVASWSSELQTFIKYKVDNKD